MSRPKSPVPDKKHVHPVAKMKRAAQVGRLRKQKAPKPRVVLGTPEAAKLGIK